MAHVTIHYLIQPQLSRESQSQISHLYQQAHLAGSIQNADSRTIDFVTMAAAAVFLLLRHSRPVSAIEMWWCVASQLLSLFIRSIV